MEIIHDPYSLEEFDAEKFMDHLRYKVGYVYVMYQDRLYQLGNNIRDWLLCWKVDFSLTKFQLFPLKRYRIDRIVGECEDVYKEVFDRHTSIKLLPLDEFQMCPLYFADPVDMETSEAIYLLKIRHKSYGLIVNAQNIGNKKLKREKNI